MDKTLKVTMALCLLVPLLGYSAANTRDQRLNQIKQWEECSSFVHKIVEKKPLSDEERLKFGNSLVSLAKSYSINDVVSEFQNLIIHLLLEGYFNPERFDSFNPTNEENDALLKACLILTTKFINVPSNELHNKLNEIFKQVENGAQHYLKTNKELRKNLGFKKKDDKHLSELCHDFKNSAYNLALDFRMAC